MRYPIKVALLSLGVILGYGSAFAHMHGCRGHHESWEQHVARVCVEAANHGTRGERALREIDSRRGDFLAPDPPDPPGAFQDRPPGPPPPQPPHP